MSLRGARVCRAICTALFSALLAAPGAYAQARPGKAAVLRSGTTCYIDSRKAMRCIRQGLATWFGQDYEPLLRRVDGKSPRDFGIKGWSGGFKDGFKVPLTPTKHTLTMAYHLGIISPQGGSSSVAFPDHDVAFTPVAGHTYTLNVVTRYEPNVYFGLPKTAEWGPLILDVTDKKRPVLVAAEVKEQDKTDHAASDGELVPSQLPSGKVYTPPEN